MIVLYSTGYHDLHKRNGKLIHMFLQRSAIRNALMKTYLLPKKLNYSHILFSMIYEKLQNIQMSGFTVHLSVLV